MLPDRRKFVERKAAEMRRQIEIVGNYGAFLRSLFAAGDWFVTLTFRDIHQDSEPAGNGTDYQGCESQSTRHLPTAVTIVSPDPRIETWEPDSRNSAKPGPPVRDAAMREIEHWLFELGWEAAGRTMVGLFEVLTHGMDLEERQKYASRFSRECVCCALLKSPRCIHHYEKLRSVATQQIGWVIAEEFGIAGGRWHVHLLVKGVKHLRRDEAWEKAFGRFGRCRIEPLHV